MTNLAMYKSLQNRARQECRSPVDRPSGIDVTKLKPEHEVHARDILDLRSTSDRTRALGPHIKGKDLTINVTVFVDFAGRCHEFEVKKLCINKLFLTQEDLLLKRHLVK